jgi:hypothetical protein
VLPAPQPPLRNVPHANSTVNPFSTDVSYIIDNVSLADEGPAVPEPSMLLLLGTGLAGLSRRLRKRTV